MRRGFTKLRALLAGAAVTAIVGGTLVFTLPQAAQAATPPPQVTATVADPPLIAGADGSLDLRFANPTSAPTGGYNLSVGIVLPTGVTIASTGGLGAPTKTYAALEPLPGSYTATPAECAAMGLEADPAASTKCRVPAGKQYTLFENVSDLPVGAANATSISLRPDASLFPVGSHIPFTVSAFTSSDATLLPLIPGTKSKAPNDAHSSGPGIASGEVDVEAFRVEKTVDLREHELLRGVHDNQAVYTIRVRHTGEGDVANSKVVDYLPAWLEYLGSGAVDNTENANGNADQAEEYAGSGPLNVNGALPGHRTEQSVETVSLDAAQATAAGLTTGPGVYTKVTWDLGTLEGSDGTKQTLPAPGTPGVLEITYRAGIPLFANTMDFPDGTPSGESLGQIANLDNNSGESTRQGQGGDPWHARSLVNTAVASGDYEFPPATPGGSPVLRSSSASGSVAVEALDVRLLKSVDKSTFEQGEVATYTLDVRTSEYVDATVDMTGLDPDGPQNHIVDDMGDGVCPIFPSGVEITGGAEFPALIIGEPGDAGATSYANWTDWNAQLGAAIADCKLPSTNPAASLTGGTLSGVAYDPATGHFFLEFAIDALPSSTSAQVTYAAVQNTNYSSHVGGTSSGDRVYNTAQLLMSTKPTAETRDATNSHGAGVGDDMRAWDDSSASLIASLSSLTKDVLPRSAGAVSASDITDSSLEWEGDLAPEPFMVGDEVWYRLVLTPPTRADVRNPSLTDMLPSGVELDGALVAGSNYVIVPTAVSGTALDGVGDCQAPAGGGAWTASTWLAKFVGNPSVSGGVITWNLGSSECVTGNTTDRYLPSNVRLTVYLKATVVGAAETAAKDLTRNLAKYQQQSRDGATSEIGVDFMRDDAGIEIAGTPSLVKGIETNAFAGITKQSGYTGSDYAAGTSGNAFDTNVDNEFAVGGDNVSFRIDLTLPESSANAIGSTTDYEVWDALPAGMTKADLVGGDTGAGTGVLVENGVEGAAIPAGAIDFRAYDPGDAGYPANVRAAYTTRTIVVWKVSASLANSVAAVAADPEHDTPEIPAIHRGFSLKYTVKVPQGADNAVLQQNYVNTASIVQYTGLGQSGTGAGVTVVPTGSNTIRENTEANLPAGAHSVPSTGTVDSSNVRVPNASMFKRLVSTEIGPSAAVNPPANTVGLNDVDAGNTQTQIAQGELATYEYLVRIPAHTTVKSGVLSDNGQFSGPVPYTVVGAKFFKGSTELATCPTGFTCSASNGKLTFPASYENTSDDFEEYRVQLTVRVGDLSHNTNLVNTARFTSGAAALQSSANAQYVEPSLTLAKSNNKTATVTAGEAITYTLKVSNAAARPASYDNAVVDTVPVGLAVNVTALKADYPNVDLGTATNEQHLVDGLGGTITWPADVENVGGTQILAKIAGGSSATLSYQATVVTTAGGSQVFKNTATVTGHTLPKTLGAADTTARRGDRTANSDSTVTAIGATLAKGVRIKGSGAAYGASASAPIGATAEYELTVKLNKQVNYYAASIVDQLPAGVEYVPGSATITVTDPSSGMTTGDWALQPIVGNKLVWQYTPNGGTVAAASDDRTVTIRYDVLLKNTVAFGTNSLPNTAELDWNATSSGDPKKVTGNATVTVLNPVLAIDKRVFDSNDAQQRNPDATLPYTIAVTNTGNTPAYNITVTDCVPAGIVVDEASITPAGSYDASATGCPGGRITWQLDGPLQHSTGTDGAMPKTITLGYSAKFAASADLSADATTGLGTALVNTADVTRFESYPVSGGRVYTPGSNGQTPVRDTASVAPIFPKITLAKAVGGTGATTAHVGESFPWKLTVVNTGRGDAQKIVVSDVLPKNWSYDAGSAMISVGGGTPVPLADPTIATGTGADSDKSVLTWTQGADAPGTAALKGAAAVANAAQRTIVITFTATPQSGATTDAGVGLVTTPHTNTLRATVTDTQNASRNKSATTYTDTDKTANAFLGSSDLAIQKQGNPSPIHAGTTTEGWKITVRNLGPDPAEGPITVTDQTNALPAGVTVSSVTGAGWTCPTITRDPDTGATSFTCSRVDPTESLASGAQFPDISVNVAVDASQPAVGPNTIVNNARVVPGKTYDRNPNNNQAGDDIEIDNLADLTIAKTVTSEPANVGESITWQIAARNAGPSVSRSTAENPITITDTVPAGVTGVTASSNADWVATLANGAPIPAGGVGAGTTIMWTYQHAEMSPSSNPAAVTLTGTVLTSHVGPIANTATVTPRITPDPETNQLTSTVTVTPRSETRLHVAKERVVSDGDGGWVTATTPFVAGEDLAYRVTVENLGPADAQAVKVVDEVPASLAYKAPHANVSGIWTRTASGATSTGTNSAWDTFALSGTLPAGQSRQFVVTYTTQPTTPSSVTNCVETTGSNWDATAVNRYDRACNDSSRTRVVDLGIEKTHTGTGPFNAGTAVSYTITVTNHGPSSTGGPITVTDELPSGMSYVANTARVSVASGTAAAAEPALSGTGNRLLTWQVALPSNTTLDPGQTIVVTLDALIDPSVRDGVALANAATVEGVENEPTGPGTFPNTTSDSVVTRTSTAMTITKAVTAPAAGPWIAGTDVTYTLTVSNTGPSEAPASVVDTLPAGLSFVSMSGTGWTCPTVGDPAVPTGSCAYTGNGGLHPVGSSTLTVVAHIASNVPPTAALPATGLVNEAVLSWSDSDGSHTDDDVAEIRITTDADLGIVKDVISGAEGDVVGSDPSDPVTATAGTTVWYRLAVSNHGTSDVLGEVTVTDILPEGITVPTTLTAVGPWAVSASAVDPLTNRQTVTFTLATGLVAGTSAAPFVAPVIEFEANLDPAIADGALLSNTATVSSETPDSNPSNDSDTALVEVERSADLAISKSHEGDSRGQVHLDEPLDFTIVVTNSGPSAASNIVVTDTIPVGLEVVSEVGPVLDEHGDPTGWTIDSITLLDPDDPTAGATIVASYAGVLGVSVDDSVSTPLIITTIPRENALGTAPNHAAVSGAEKDPVLENNEVDDPIDVRPRVTLVVDKSVVGELKVGTVGEYRIAVSNTGPHGDPGPITVTDALPAGLTFNAAPDLPAGVTFARDGETLTWTIADGLDVDASVSLRLLVNVGEAAYPSVVNTAIVDSPAEKTQESVLSSSAAAPVSPPDPLSLTGGQIGLGVGIATLLVAGGLLLAVRRRRERPVG